jgi:hypothetical protein
LVPNLVHCFGFGCFGTRYTGLSPEQECTSESGPAATLPPGGREVKGGPEQPLVLRKRLLAAIG